MCQARRPALGTTRALTWSRALCRCSSPYQRLHARPQGHVLHALCSRRLSSGTRLLLLLATFGGLQRALRHCPAMLPVALNKGPGGSRRLQRLARRLYARTHKLALCTDIVRVRSCPMRITLLRLVCASIQQEPGGRASKGDSLLLYPLLLYPLLLYNSQLRATMLTFVH